MIITRKSLKDTIILDRLDFCLLFPMTRILLTFHGPHALFLIFSFNNKTIKQRNYSTPSANGFHHSERKSERDDKIR